MSEEIYLEMERDLSMPVPEPRFPDYYIIINTTENCGRLWETAMDACFGNYEAGAFRYVIVANAYYAEDRAFVVLNEKNEPIATSNSWETEISDSIKTGYISFVGVVPSHQGKGLAIQMLNYTLRDIQKHGFKSSLIGVRKDNYPAVNYPPLKKWGLLGSFGVVTSPIPEGLYQAITFGYATALFRIFLAAFTSRCSEYSQ